MYYLAANQGLPGPRGETFARAVHRRGAKFEDLELFLKVLQPRSGKIQ